MFGPRQLRSFLHRLTAVLGIALVLLLNVLAVSPELHAWVHDHSAADQTGADHDPVGSVDHVCAVTLFAHGVTPLLFLCLLLLARPLVSGPVALAPDWLAVIRPRYWLVPSHAPPSV
jgi:hypothetical protein